MNIYKGTTKKILLELLDSSGTQIPAGDVDNVEVYLRNAKSGKLYAKYSITAQTGFLDATIVTDKVQVAIDADITATMEVGELEIFTKTFVADADFPLGNAISPNKGILAYVKEV